MTPLRIWAGAGVVTWTLVGVALDPGWIEWMLLLSPLVLIPLAAETVLINAPPPPWAIAGPGAACAILAALSYRFEPGAAAALLVVPWCVCTFLAAWWGMLRLRREIGITLDSLLVPAATGFMAVGGVWLVATRLGVRPLGFSATIVLLTATHFHHAGVVLPVIASHNLANRPTRIVGIGSAGVLAGIPLTAIGITLGGKAEWVAAWVLALAAILIAVGQLRLAIAVRAPLLAVSGAALLVAMILGGLWAWSRAFPGVSLSLEEMARYHGSLNALGFGLLGLIGWQSVLRHGPTPSRGAGRGVRNR